MKIDIGIKDKDRKAVAAALGQILADTYTLSLKTHNFHWNVTGPLFSVLHALFEEQYKELVGAADEVAERIRALGHEAPGGLAEFARLTRIVDAGRPLAAKEMIARLLADHEAMVRHARATKDLAEGVGDAETGDMMIERMQEHAKTAWMLRAQLA